MDISEKILQIKTDLDEIYEAGKQGKLCCCSI